jgi:O-antigen ligase
MEWDTLGLPRMNGFSYEPAYFALYLVPGVLVLLCLAARQGKRGLGFGLLAVAFLVAIALSTSRSGWLGVAVGVALMLLLLAVRAGRGPALRLALASLAGLAVCAMVMAASPALRAHLTRFAKMGVDVNERTSSAPRLEAMAEAATIFRQHPVLGVGFAGYGGYTINHPVGLTRTDRGPFKLVTANLYLELAAETGALGLAAALWLLWVLIAPLLRRSRPDEPPQLVATREGLLLACMVVFLVMFHFNQTLWRLDIWILLALSFAAGTLPGSPAGDRTA